MSFSIGILSHSITGGGDGRCPHCRTRLEKEEGGFLFVKNAIIKVDLRTRLATAKCPQCKRWVEVPLQLAGP